MIRIYEVIAPMEGKDPGKTKDVLTFAMDNLRRLYLSLVDFTVDIQDDTLTLTLKVSAKDRWACSTAARKIGSGMLARVRIPVDKASLELVGMGLPGSSLSAERGRNVSNHRPRGAGAQKASEAVD